MLNSNNKNQEVVIEKRGAEAENRFFNSFQLNGLPFS